MKQRTVLFRVFIILCGIAAILAFFLAPIWKEKINIVNSLVGYLTGSGSGNGTRVTAWTFLNSVLKDHYTAEISGYSSVTSCVLLFGLPVIGAIGMIVFGAIGRKVGGIGAIISGAVSGLSYILQMILFPEPVNLTYEFSFWQILLIVVSLTAVVMGICECVSASRFEYGESSVGNAGYHYGTGEYGGVGTGALVGVKGEYSGATIEIPEGTRIAIGRNSDICNLVLQERTVSRIHCYVSYFADRNAYCVMDVSKFGVYDSRNNPIDKNVEVYMGPGDRIRIGQSDNEFALR